MKHLFKLINLSFWKSWFGPFFAFVFPIIFIGLLGSIIGYYAVFGGTLAIAAMAVGLTTLPQSVFEFKRSVLLKRIGTTNIRPWMFLAAIAGFYAIIMLIATIFSLVVGLAIFSNYWDEGKVVVDAVVGNGTLEHPEKAAQMAPPMGVIMNNVSWGSFIYGILLNIIISISLGLFLSAVCKSTIAIQAIGVSILIISQFLSAQVLSIAMVKEIDALYYVSYLTPFKYTTGMIIESFTGSPNLWKGLDFDTTANIFDIHTPFATLKNDSITHEEIVIFNKGDKVVNLIMPFFIVAGVTALTVKTFKWTTRG